MTPALRSEVDQCKQRLKEEREAEAKADDVKKERLQILQQSGGFPGHHQTGKESGGG